MQLMEWEKICANNVTNNRLLSKIHKQFIQLNIKKNSVKKWAEVNPY